MLELNAAGQPKGDCHRLGYPCFEFVIYSTGMRKTAKTTAFALFALVLFSLAASCSRTEPKITYGFMELVYYQDRDKPLERFSFFVLAEDEDGTENLADLYLYHDREQLRWHITSDDWVNYFEDGKTWVGTRSIAGSDDESLPRGQYRAVLVNKGGEKSERYFSFDAPEAPVYPFPALEISGGRYSVNSSYPENRLVCYDEKGNYVFTANLESLSGSMSELEMPSGVQSAALWAYDAQRYTSAFTDVAAIRR